MVISSSFGLFLQSFTLADLFIQWEQFGVFDLFLPFLLIFALIYGILHSTNVLGTNNGIKLIIALVIALMAMRLQFVTLFFTTLFPRFAIGLAIIMVALIMTGLFIPPDWNSLKGWYMFFGIAALIITVVAVVNSFDALGFLGSSWFSDYATLIISGIVVIAVIVSMVSEPSVNKGKAPQHYTMGPVRG